MTWLALLAAGAGAGVLAGLLGIGGGFVFVPVLLLLYREAGVAPDAAMPLAVGTSLAAIVPTSLSSVYAHARKHNVDWSAFARLAPGLVLGALAGAALAASVDGRLLERVFGAFLVAVAVQLVLELRPAAHRDLPGRFATGAAGGVIGAFSALIGIGGGTLTAPYLVWCNRPMLLAVGTAAAAGLPIAVTAALGFTAAGLVEWPAALALGGAAMLAAPLGARLAHAAPARVLRRAFAGLLILVAAGLLLGAA